MDMREQSWCWRMRCEWWRAEAELQEVRWSSLSVSWPVWEGEARAAVEGCGSVSCGVSRGLR